MIKIFIYGSHGPMWDNALSPRSPMWKNVENRVIYWTTSQKELQKGFVIIPMMEPHIKEILTLKNQGYKAFLPNEYYLSTFSDKVLFASYLQEIHLTHLSPHVYQDDNIKFPCVFKPANLNAGEGMKILDSLESLRSSQVKYRRYVLQEVILGDREYITHIICSAGSVLWHCTYVYQLPTDQTLKTPIVPLIVTKVSISDAILAELILFVRPYDDVKSGYTGICNIGYKIVNGHVIVFEINPRLGGSLMLLQNSGDLREALLCLAQHAVDL